jgi:perosamine synthetase
MSLPFLPYGRQEIDDEDVAAVVASLRSDYLTTGPTVGAFEEALAASVGAKYAVAISNGTAALHAACAAAGLGPGDEALVPAVTFLATANAARYVGAEPVFVDVNPDDALIDLEDAARRLTPRTKAILPVHMTGRPADMAAVAAFARAHGLVVIEDAAHALGASFQGHPIGDGAFAQMATFSFHPVKHITTAEGGAITTQDPALYARLSTFRTHGMVREPAQLQRPSPGPWYYEQHELGYNYRLTDVQCALGLSQLRKLPGFLARRRALAARYDALLAGVAGVQPAGVGHPDAESAWHLYAVLIDFEAAGVDRATVMGRLKARGVGTQVHYIPVPEQPYYMARGADPAHYPGARRWYARTLSLPLYPGMADGDVERVVVALQAALQGE